MSRWAQAKALAEAHGLDANVVYNRLRLGWSEVEVVNIPVQRYRRGHEIARRARDNGIPPRLAWLRVSYGWTVERATTTPRLRTWTRRKAGAA